MKTFSELDRIAKQFNDCTLPHDLWSHEAHLKVGIWHLLNYSFDEALKLLRKRIRAYNDCNGTPNTDDSGYHETVTRFFLILINERLQQGFSKSGNEASVNELLESLADPQLILGYYSKAVLFSVDARRTWIKPDLRPLDDGCPDASRKEQRNQTLESKRYLKASF